MAEVWRIPIQYWILEAEDLTYARWSGQIAPAEMRANFEAYLADPRYRPGRPELVDLQDVASIDISIKTMMPLLSLVNDQDFKPKAGTKTVIITNRKVIFGIARMYQLLASSTDGISVHVFDNEAEALSALDRPEGTIAEFSTLLPKA